MTRIVSRSKSPRPLFSGLLTGGMFLALLLCLALPSLAQRKPHRILWSGDVDGTIELQIHKRQVKVHKVSGKNLEHEQKYFSSSLPEKPVMVQVRKKEGRGNVTVFQQPAASNKYTLGVRIEDNQAGRSHYRLVLTW